MIKKQVFSMIAAAAFLLTIGGTVAAKSLEEATIWQYEDGTLTDDPLCGSGDQVCAREFPTLPNGQPDTSNPPLSIRNGKR